MCPLPAAEVSVDSAPSAVSLPSAASSPASPPPEPSCVSAVEHVSADVHAVGASFQQVKSSPSARPVSASSVSRPSSRGARPWSSGSGSGSSRRLSGAGAAPAVDSAAFAAAHQQLLASREATHDSCRAFLAAAACELAAREAAAAAAAEALCGLRARAASSARTEAGKPLPQSKVDASLARAAAADVAVGAARRELAILQHRLTVLELTASALQGPAPTAASPCDDAQAVRLRGAVAEKDLEVRRLRAHERTSQASLADLTLRLHALQATNALLNDQLASTLLKRDCAAARRAEAKAARDAVKAQISALGADAGLVSAPALLADLAATQDKREALRARLSEVQSQLTALAC